MLYATYIDSQGVRRSTGPFDTESQAIGAGRRLVSEGMAQEFIGLDTTPSGVSTEQGIQQPPQAPQPATSPFIQVGPTGIPAPQFQPIQKKSYQYYDENAQQVESPEFASQQEADTWAQSQGLYKTYDEVFGWHQVTDSAGLPKQVYGTLAQAKQVGTVIPKISTGDPKLDAALQGINSMLQGLTTAGYQINPDVPIDEKALAEFTKIAEGQINPAFTEQLKIARENLFTSLRYSKEDIDLLEQSLARKYPQELRQLGETYAERGLAYSGERKLAEEELATQTGETLSGALKQTRRVGGGLVGTFAQQYGLGQLPAELPQLTEQRVIPGQETFEKGIELPIYELSPSMYETLKDVTGSEEWKRKAGIRELRSTLAGKARELGSVEDVRKIFE